MSAQNIVRLSNFNPRILHKTESSLISIACEQALPGCSDGRAKREGELAVTSP